MRSFLSECSLHLATGPPRSIPGALQPPIYHQAVSRWCYDPLHRLPFRIWFHGKPKETIRLTLPCPHWPISWACKLPERKLNRWIWIAFSAQSLSRAGYARLQGKEFPTIKDTNNKEAEIMDIRQPRFLNMDTEMTDPLNCNQINFHFLAYFK